VSSPSTGYFRSGEDWIHRRNPITKLISVLWVLLAAFLLPPVSLVGLLVLIIAVATSAGELRNVLVSLRIPLVLLTSIVVVNALLFPGATQVIAAIGPLHLSADGLQFGLVSAGRILVAFMAAMLLLLTTLADDLLESLVARGVSHRLAFVVLSAVQLVPRLQARAGAILDAQQARGLRVTGSFITRARALVPLVGPILLGSLIDVRERTFALEARAFGARPQRTAYRVVADPPVDHWLRLGLALAAVGVIVAAIAGVGR
jgi:energy-coupling factor transport system permease protein